MRSTSPVPLGLLSQASGVALCGALLLTPLAYAATRPVPFLALAWGLHAVGALWLLALLIERRRPGTPRSCLAVALALAAYAWIRLAVAPPEPISAFTQNHLARIFERWPESTILRTPFRVTLLLSGLLCALLVVSDLSRRTRWRRAFHYTMLAAAGAVVVIGLAQNATRAQGIFWQVPQTHMPSRFFGPFYHFTSAGAFLNLTWPVAASLALAALNRHFAEGKPLRRALGWGALAFLLLLGHAAHISRFPQAIALVVLLTLLAVHRPWSRVRWTARTAAVLAVCAGLAVLVAGWAISRTGRISEIRSRWNLLHFGRNPLAVAPPPRPAWPLLMRDDLIVPSDTSNYFLGDRGAAYTFALQAVTLHPVIGFGPGGWTAAVSQYAEEPVLGTFYLYLQFTHEDYLQTWIEWGTIGAVLGAFLVVGGGVMALKRIRREGRHPTGRPDLPALLIGALLAAGAVMTQALIDFPLQIPANALYASTLLALCWSSASRRLPSGTSSLSTTT